MRGREKEIIKREREAVEDMVNGIATWVVSGLVRVAKLWERRGL